MQKNVLSDKYVVIVHFNIPMSDLFPFILRIIILGPITHLIWSQDIYVNCLLGPLDFG